MHGITEKNAHTIVNNEVKKQFNDYTIINCNTILVVLMLHAKLVLLQLVLMFANIPEKLNSKFQ